MRILGIDPGFDGGYAIIETGPRPGHTDIEERIIGCFPLPVLTSQLSTKTKSGKNKTRRHYDLAVMKMILWKNAPDLVLIEKMQPMPAKNKQGKRSGAEGSISTFRLGEGFGQLQGLCCGTDRSYDFVRPQEWKKLILVGYDKSDKNSSVLFIQRRRSTIELTGNKKQRQGQADAICIALYGLWLHSNRGA